LKLRFLEMPESGGDVAPPWGRGLKPRLLRCPPGRPSVAPPWGRGLKLGPQIRPGPPDRRRPPVGAWIETSANPPMAVVRRSPPRGGVD